MCHDMRKMYVMHGMECNCDRHFLTKEEKIEKLQEYKKWLENEKKGVEEAITKLKSN